MNMGIGDGVDLGWKLSAVLQGWAGDDLLDSYQVERRPVHQVVIDEAVANFSVPPAPPDIIEQRGWPGRCVRALIGGKIRKAKAREFHTLGTVLGLVYEGSPWVAVEAGEAPPHNNSRYKPTARPGFLAPHAWLADGRSLYDLFGPGFTLLVTVDGDSTQIENAKSEAASLGVPLHVVRPADGRLRALYRATLALIRPDQHVAWRGEHWQAGILGLVTRGPAHSADARADSFSAVPSASPVKKAKQIPAGD